MRQWGNGAMGAPPVIETARLILAPPCAADAVPIFERYAADPDVTRFVGWPRHESLDDTRLFIRFSDLEWQRWPAGPFLIRRREDGQVIGGTGLSFDTPDRASTGYVLSRDAWGRGYATEALRAMVDLAREAGVTRLYALCHPDHRASIRVLEKNGFTREGIWRQRGEFPNLTPGVRADVLCHALTFGAPVRVA